MEPYLALFEPDRKAGGYVVTFPDFGYGVTQGESDHEAMEMAQDLLMLTLGGYISESRPLPTPGRHRGSKFRSVALPALQAAKVDLYGTFLESVLNATRRTANSSKACSSSSRNDSLRVFSHSEVNSEMLPPSRV